MIFGIITLLIALAIAGVAAWFSIVGLMAIFSASALSIAIMAGTLEVGKLVAASWLYRHWRDTTVMMKTYLTLAVVVLMLITSMGIFGYLSKAHLDQAAVGGNNQLQIQQIEMRIEREQRKITDANTVISQLDQTVQTLMDYDRIRGPEGALAVRESQSAERAQLNNIIDTATNTVLEYQTQLLPLREQQLQTELKVGPLKYVAELIYGESGEEVLDKAVRLFIILLVIVFDPLAIVMILAANQTLMRHGITLEKQYEKQSATEEPLFDDIPFDSENYNSQSLNDDIEHLMQVIAEKDKKISELNSETPEVIVQEVPVEIEVIKEVPVEIEKIVEVPVPEVRYEKVPVEVVKEVPVEIEVVKEVEKIVEVVKEVPVEIEVIKEVEKIVEVENTDKIDELNEHNKELLDTIANHDLEKRTLDRKIERLSKQVNKLKDQTASLEKTDNEKILALTAEVEQLIEERERFLQEEQMRTERDKDELRKTAHMLSNSELNKEDLSEEEIYVLLKKTSEEDVKRKMGFWAVPLPNVNKSSDNKK